MNNWITKRVADPEPEPQFGISFGSPATASSSSACGFFGFGCTTTMATSSSTAPIPEGTGPLTTLTTTNFFGTATITGRVFAITTTDAAGDFASIQEVLDGSGNTYLISATMVTPSTASATRTSSASLTSSSSSSASSSSASSSSATLAGAAQTAAASNTQQNTSGSGISGGAIAAAVIVPILVLGLIAVLAFFLIRRRRRAAARAGPAYVDHSASPSNVDSNMDSPFFAEKRVATADGHYVNNNGSGSSTATSTNHNSRMGSSDKEMFQKAVHPASGHPALNNNNNAPPRLDLPIGVAMGDPQQLDSREVSSPVHHYSTTSPTAVSELPGGDHSPVSPGGAREIPQQLFAPAFPQRDNQYLSPEQSGRNSFDEETASAISDAEYPEVEVASAAVGVAHRASVINMINNGSNSPPKSGRGGSLASSRKSSS